MHSIVDEIQNHLFELQDLKYKEFHCRLMPTVSPETVIGIQIPKLRAYAKELYKNEDVALFLDTLPHTYYEENNLHAFLLEKLDDYGTVIELTEKFLPYIDNWATCDSFSPVVFKKHLPQLYEKILQWIKADKVYTVRFAIEMLMTHYLEDNFRPEAFELVANVKSDEYYINMMIAWYFATALAKQYDRAVVYLQDCRLDRWTHNKTIQKAIESYRISDDTKKYLRTLKIK